MKKLLFWSIMVVSLVACSGNNKTITYTTTNGEIVEVKQTAFDAEIVSNTYENGEGKIVFDKPLTSIGRDAFYWCSLTSITIPNSVTSIGNWAFEGCKSLTSVTIPNSVTSIGERAFYECNSLTSINVDSNNPNYSSVDGVLFDKDKTTLIQCPIGNTRSEYTIPNSVTSIGSSAFSYCYDLTSITIPNSVTSIGNRAFQDCRSLTSVTIPNSVTSIADGAFENCESLTSITIPNSVTSIGDEAFWNCYYLRSITIPNSVTSIGDEAFWNCESLRSVTIPNSVIWIGGLTFYKCSSLTSVTIPNSVILILGSAFAECSSLTSVKYTGTKEQWNKIEKSDWADNSYIQVVRCTDGEIRL